MIPIIKAKDAAEIKTRLLSRTQLSDESIVVAVKDIVKNVRERGDEALFEYTKKFDKAELNAKTVRVSREEIAEAYQAADEKWLNAMREAAKRITAFHAKQKQKTWIDFEETSALGQLVRPIEKAGVYVPGGTAAYPSSVLMNVLPAKVAGVEKIVMVTPPDAAGKVSYPLTLVAANIAGVDEIYKVGGAQAVAALAFGTESIPKVDKISGPGNIYVANAKREVFGFVGIDMVAGPSEVLVIADESANPVFVAADLLSQAEHDAFAAVVLVTDCETLAQKVQKEIETQTAKLARREIVEKSLKAYGTIVLVDDLDEAVEVSNLIAPEHLELSVKDPYALLGKIKNAGAVFMGHYSPEPLGDYFAGPNHVLPTSGTARFFSPLSVDDFMKKSSVIYYSKEALAPVAKDIIRLAKNEGLDAHANSVAVRFGIDIEKI